MLLRYSRIRLHAGRTNCCQEVIRREVVLIVDEHAQQFIVVQDAHVTFDFCYVFPRVFEKLHANGGNLLNQYRS